MRKALDENQTGSQSAVGGSARPPLSVAAVTERHGHLWDWVVLYKPPSRPLASRKQLPCKRATQLAPKDALGLSTTPGTASKEVETQSYSHWT